ncbi:hypothetical protein AB0I22_21400 [Streptomyces sp. NPDC050610]
MAKHARPRKRNKTEEESGKAQERRKRAMIAIKAATLIWTITHSCSSHM